MAHPAQNIQLNYLHNTEQKSEIPGTVLSLMVKQFPVLISKICSIFRFHNNYTKYLEPNVAGIE